MKGRPVYIRITVLRVARWRPAPRRASVPRWRCLHVAPCQTADGRAWWAVPSAQLGGGLLESSVSFSLSSSVSHRWSNCEVADHGRRPTFGAGSSFSRAMICAPRATSGSALVGQASVRWRSGAGVRVRVRVRLRVRVRVNVPARRGTRTRSSTACLVGVRGSGSG